MRQRALVGNHLALSLRERPGRCQGKELQASVRLLFDSESTQSRPSRELRVITFKKTEKCVSERAADYGYNEP